MTAMLNRTGFSFEVAAAPFADAVAWAARSVPTRPPTPTLGGMVLEVRDDSLTVSGFDGDTATTATILAVGNLHGRFVVSGRLLDAVVGSFGATPIEVRAVDANRLMFLSGTARVTLPLMPASGYPDLPVLPDPIGSVDAAAFARSVHQVAAATGAYTEVALLAGFAMWLESDRIRMAATDRYRAAVDQVAWMPDIATVETAVVASTMLAKLAPAFGADGGRIAVSHSNVLLGFSTPRRSAVIRRMIPDTPSGEYPDMDAGCPRRGEAPLRVSVRDLAEPVKRSALVAPKSSVRLALRSQSVTVSIVGDDGQASQDVACEYAGPPLEIATNPQYLLDAIHACGSPVVDLSFIDPKRPYVVTPVDIESSYRHIVMPIRLG